MSRLPSNEFRGAVAAETQTQTRRVACRHQCWQFAAVAMCRPSGWYCTPVGRPSEDLETHLLMTLGLITCHTHHWATISYNYRYSEKASVNRNVTEVFIYHYHGISSNQ